MQLTRRLISLAIFGAMTLSLPVSAQVETHTFSLAEAQAYALEHAFANRNSRLEAEVARREVKETTAQGLPQINGSLEYNNYIDIPVQVAQGDVFAFPPYLTNFLGGVAAETGVPLNAPAADPDAISEFQFGASQQVTAGISATQLIFDGAYFVGLQASKAYAEAMAQGTLKTEAETRLAVAEAYHTVLVARENQRILGESRDLLESSLIETQALLETGFAETLDVDQLELSLADLDSRIRYAEMQADAALDLLKFRMGMPLEHVLELSDELEALLTGGESSLLQTTFNPQGIPDYKMQLNYVELAELGVKLEKSKLLPSISGFYNYQRNAQRFEFDFFDFDQKWYPIQIWGVQMRVPIFASGLTHHRIQKAKVEALRADAALTQIEEGIKLEYRAARIEFDNALAQREIQNANLQLAQRIFERNQIKYNEGLASSLELTQVRNQLLTAQGNYINATLSLLNAKARLNKALNNF